MTSNPPKISCPCPVKGWKNRLESQAGDVTPLSSVCGRKRFRVCGIRGDRKICARMAQLGVLPGSEIEVVCPGRSTQCMVRVKGSTVSLDQLVADNILVTPV